MCTTVTTPVSSEATKKLIALIWTRNRLQMLARLDLLDRAAASASCPTPEPRLCEEAALTAHNLAGSLGMFGFQEATLVARILEQGFEAAVHDGPMLTKLICQLREILFATAL